jgi:hypothetical protein
MVTVDGSLVFAAPPGSTPVAVATFLTLPCVMSAWVVV